MILTTVVLAMALAGGALLVWLFPPGDGSARVPARRRAAEDPAFAFALLGFAVVLSVVIWVLVRRMRPNMLQEETRRHVAEAARLAAQQIDHDLLRRHGTVRVSEDAAREAAVQYLTGLDGLDWPYEPHRITVDVATDQVEVIAERSFQKPSAGPQLHWGGVGEVRRMDVRGRATARPSLPPPPPG